MRWLLAAVGVGASLSLAVFAHEGAAIARCGRAAPVHVGALGAVAYMHGHALRVVDLASGRDRKLSTLANEHAQLAWSADGRWISAGDLLVPAAGGPPCVALAAGSVLLWGPTGDLLAATSPGDGVFAGSVGSALRRLLPSGWTAGGFDPSGTRLAALGPRLSLWVVDVASGARKLVYRSPNLHVGPPVFARWSPDGRWLLFWTDTEESGSIAADGLPLLAVPAAGGHTVRLARAVLATQEFVQTCGRAAVVVSTGFDRYVSARKSVQMLVPPNWRARDLSRDSSRSWYAATCAPGGTRIAATATRNRDEGAFDSLVRTIWLLRTNGTRRLLVSPLRPHVSDEAPRFSHDGRLVLYVEHPAHPEPTSRLYLIDLESGKRRGPFATLNADPGYYGLHDWSREAAWYQPSR